MHVFATAAAVAERQHLLITAWQLRIIGVSDQALADRIAKHGWRRLGRGIIALPGPDTRLRTLAAFVLAHSRPTAVGARVEKKLAAGEELADALVRVALDAGQIVTGYSALWLHDIASYPSQHSLRVRRPTGTVKREGLTVRFGAWAGDVNWIEGLPVADVEQALCDVAAGGDTPSRARVHHDLTKLIATADRRRKTSLDALEARLGQMPRFVGGPALRRAIADLRGELSHSATEKKARAIVRKVLAKHGLVLHPRPFAVDHAGRTVGEADLAVVEICLDLEVDGPHHLLPAQVRKDQARDRDMRRAGWEVERFATELIDERPVTFAARVDECVRARLARRSDADFRSRERKSAAEPN